MYTIIIIEDETLAANRLEILIKKYDARLVIAAKLAAIKTSVQWLQQHPQPDLIFMDIHLEDGESFAILEQTRVQSPIIFTTAFEEHPAAAHVPTYFGYLSKPINQQELARLLDAFRDFQKKDRTDSSEDFQVR